VKVKRIDLDDEAMPESITVELSHDESVFLAALLGRMKGNQEEKILAGGSVLVGALYEGLAGGVFNRFYENGVEDAVQEARARQGSARPERDICWCGREKQPGEDHAMCYPGMD
jgi:hypothetical protein